MHHPHVHVYDDKGELAMLYLDQDGHARGKGHGAHHILHEIDHGDTHGKAKLDAIVQRFDRSTRIAAVHCDCDCPDCTP